MHNPVESDNEVFHSRLTGINPFDHKDIVKDDIVILEKLTISYRPFCPFSDNSQSTVLNMDNHMYFRQRPLITTQRGSCLC